MPLVLFKPGWDSSLLLMALILMPAIGAQGQQGSNRQFAPGTWNSIEELPAGTFRDRLEQLPPQARERALGWLRQVHFPESDVDSLHADAAGGIYYACDLIPQGREPEGGEVTSMAGPVPVSPFPVGLVFHSRPGSPNVLYLNFAGDTISGTAWNSEVGRSSIPAVAFSIDGDHANYSDSEQTAIKRIWQRVAEDFAPFDIDVTTERPTTFNNRTAHLLITRSTDADGASNPSPTAGGVAYVNVFNLSSYSTYRPAWVYVNNLGGVEALIAEAGSHEIGHNLGLSHDGRTGGTEYYGGHGSGETSWGPLMGTGYYRNVSQWCRGDYYLANNAEDDLAIISGKITHRPDDHGDTRSTATPLVLTGVTNVVSTTPETDPTNTNPANKGMIETTGDVDVISLVTGNGPVWLAVNPWVTPAGTRGNNLDVVLELRDAGGGLIATNNPASQTGALIQTNLPQGLYFLTVRNTGTGDPFGASPSGYTDYGTLGQYFMSGYITEPAAFVVPPVADLQFSDLTDPGVNAFHFAVIYADDVGVDVSTIDSFDIRVVGPRGYDRLAQLVAVDTLSDGSPRLATYSATAPDNLAWSAADNGAYSIRMEPLQVSDVEGAAVTSGVLGQFRVVLPSVVYAADMNMNPGWDLDTQWEYGLPSYGSSGPSAGFTGNNIIGYNLDGNYGNNINPVRYATTPAIDCTGSTVLTLQFQRWLRLRSGDSAVVEVSANGSDWVSLWSTTRSVTDSAWQEQSYPLPAAMAGSSTIRVRWGLGSSQSLNDLGWNIDDVLVLDGGLLDTNPPGAVLLVDDVSSGGSLDHECTVIYSDVTAVLLSSLGSSNLWVSGPGGYLNNLSLGTVNTFSDDSPVVASYGIPAPGGQWNWQDNGTYQLVVRGGEVEDVYHNAMTETVLGDFQVSIPTPGVLGVMPVGELETSGTVGGPFVPDSFAYTLTNAGAFPLNWVAGANGSWFDVYPTAGTLAAGAAVLVDVTVLPVAEGYAAGSYDGTVFFQNVSGGGGSATRQVSLNVLPLPTFDLAVSASPEAWGSVMPAGGSYLSNSTVELLATPAQYFRFAQWAGAFAGTNNPLSLTIQSNVVLSANFAEVLTAHHPTPHWWLASYGYTNDFESAVDIAGANGMALWQTYVAGLNPTNPASQLRLSLESLVPAVLNWEPVTGRLYSLSSSTNGFEDFELLSGAVDLPWPIHRFTNSADDPAGGFYRLEVRKP